MRKLRYATKRAIFKLSPKAAQWLNIDFRLHAANRDFLEQSVFSYINQMAAKVDETLNTLFVGIDKHNWHYPRLLRAAFHSLDIEPSKAVYGQPGTHWTGSATEMANHYGSDVFDVVVANGLMGFGINNAADFERLLAHCDGVLKPGGLLILGYNDRPDRVSYPVLPVVRGIFDEFVPVIPGVNSALHRVDDQFRHVFLFLRKRDGIRQGCARRAGGAKCGAKSIDLVDETTLLHSQLH